MNTVLFGILMDAFFIILLAWCACTDWSMRIVSNIPIALLLGLGFVHTAFIILTDNIWWLYPAGLLVVIPFLIAWIKNRMGAADVKLVMSIGLYLGLLNTLVAFVLMLPILATLLAYSWLKHKTLKCRIPLAPILAFGAAGTVALGYLYALMK